MTVQPRWQSLADSLRGDNPGRYFSKDEVRRFDEFVATVPRGERVAMLLDAYQAYRQSAGMPASAEQHFEGSVASVLIQRTSEVAIGAQ